MDVMLSVASSPFAHLLKRLRASAGLTQGELADRAGLSARAISDLERGIKQRPHADTVERLARALDLESHELARFRAAARGSGSPSRSGSGLVVELRPATPESASSGVSDGTTTRPSVPCLPLPLTSFVGREKELLCVLEMLRQGHIRLLTLTGAGGTGKTRLALQGATQMADAFPDGSCFVSLASISNPGLVASAIARALGLREQGAQTLMVTLSDHLREKRLLLVLDNFEHLLEAAPLVGDLLAQCPSLTILVTSRAVLHLTAEHVFSVPALALPDPASPPEPALLPGYDAIALFLARAAAARADFVLTAENAPAVAEICYRLDGLPLAIELAAARIRLFPPHALLGRLSHRLGVLTGGARDLPTRQQTLHRTIEWSYALLSSEEQRLFRRLAVFVGGCTLGAVDAVCAGEQELDVVQGVASLVDQSLLPPVDVTRDEPRVVMLETIREYALERLEEGGEVDATHRRHAEYYLALAEEAEPGLVGAAQTAWLPRLEQEHDNFRAALRWYVATGDAEQGLRLGGALWRFWYVHSHFTEGRQWLDQLLALPSKASPTPARAKALNGAGNLAYSQGDYPSAQTCHEESLKLRRQLDDRRGIAASLNNLALLARDQGDFETAVELLEQSVSLSRSLGLHALEALALGNLGSVRRLQDAYEDAYVLHAQALALFTAEGDHWGRAMELAYLADIAHAQGELDRARAYYDESCALRRDVGDRRGLAVSLAGLAAVVLAQGEIHQARVLLVESLSLREAVGDVMGQLDALEGAAVLAAATGRMAQGVRLASAAAFLRAGQGVVGARPSARLPFAPSRLQEERWRELGEGVFKAARADDAGLSLAQALSLARQVLHGDG